MAAESGGHYADPFFAFLMVYNAIKGNYEVSTDGFYDMVFPYMFVASSEDYANYAQYFTGSELPYYSDEIAALAELSMMTWPLPALRCPLRTLSHATPADRRYLERNAGL